MTVKKKIKKTNSVSEFRKDPVSGDWILVAIGRKSRPVSFNEKKKARIVSSKEKCPFEDPQKENKFPILWYPKPEIGASEDINDWFLQVIPNKYPFVTPFHICPKKEKNGIYKQMEGTGFSEVIVTRDHIRTIADMNKQEVELVVRSYQERYLTIKNEGCVSYVLIFHNYGPQAGASISHPHSQLIALPISPPDVKRSLKGSRYYFEKNNRCVYCAVLDFEIKEKMRIVYKNGSFVALAPFAPRVSFEVRIYPKIHSPYFENITNKDREDFAEALRFVLGKMKIAMNDPDYNFFIHTAPIGDGNDKHYHWHCEILPRSSIWAGVELGTGIEVVAVSPEEAAERLRSV